MSKIYVDLLTGKSYKYNMRDFQIAYRWLYGETLKKGAEIYKKSSAEYVHKVVQTYINTFVNSIISD